MRVGISSQVKPTLFSLAAALLLSFPARADKFQTKGGFVPDAATAIKIAVAVWTPIYGEAHIAEEKPYHATLKGGVWTVEGSMHPPNAPGGVAFARISQKDGRILEVVHGQ